METLRIFTIARQKTGRMETKSKAAENIWKKETVKLVNRRARKSQMHCGEKTLVLPAFVRSLNISK